MTLDYIIFKNSLEAIDLTKAKVINTINPHSYCVSKKDKVFKEALKASDILLPDGVGIVWAKKIVSGTKIKKIAGNDLFLFLMQKLDTEKGSVFFLGSSQETLNKIKMKCSIEYPNITFGGFSPPYKTTFSEEDSKIMYKEVNIHKPDVLFVGMTAPKQEKWVYAFKNHLEVKNICAVGAVFDFYAGNVNRSSVFWINLGLEWLPRLIKEPRRLFYRNFVSTPKFILEVICIKFFGKGIL